MTENPVFSMSRTECYGALFTTYSIVSSSPEQSEPPRYSLCHQRLMIGCFLFLFASINMPTWQS